MKNKPVLFLAALAMLAVIGGICIMSVWNAGEGGYTFRIFDFSFGRNAQLRNTIELSTAEVNSLKLEYGSKNVIVCPAAGEKITIKEYLYSDHPEAQASVTYRENNEVVVTGGNVHTIVVFGFSINAGERIEVYLPDKALAAFSLQNGSGNITGECGGVTEDGSISITAGSGNIKWAGTEAKELFFQAGSGNIKLAESIGDIKIQTNSGNISGDALKGSLSASAGSGNITLTRFAGGGSISAGSGNLNVEALWVDKDLEMQTGSGNIKLEVPEELKFHLEINTGSGSIHTDFDEVLSFHQDGNSAKGDIGEEPDINIRLKANSGNVRVLD